MKTIITVLINHIKSWNMVWFGLIFWGSVLNAFAAEFGLLANNPNLSYFFFLFGLILVNFFPLKIFPKTRPPISEQIATKIEYNM